VSIVKENPLPIVEGIPPDQGAAAPGFGRAVVPEDPLWAQVYEAVEALRATLAQLNLLARQPAVAHDFVAVLAALDAVRGETFAEPYWRAYLERLVNLHPQLQVRKAA